MAFTLRVMTSAATTGSDPQFQPLAALLSCDNAEAQVELRNPLTTANADSLQTENLIQWYLEKYATEEPFEISKAELAAETIKSYGRDLASQLAGSRLLPKAGDLEIEIVGRNRLVTDATTSEPSSHTAQDLHWEVLEDIKLWPAGFKLSSVSVYRTVPSGQNLPNSSIFQNGNNETKNGSNILLVVSRPGQAGEVSSDIDYQLVSRCLVAMVDQIPKKNPGLKVTLKILRPPTWLAFREHLQEYNPGYYDLVHLDMHGKIRESAKSPATAVLSFCKPGLTNPLAMKRDYRSGDEIGEVLSQAGVRIVVLNACDSANLKGASTSGNLAEVLLFHNVESVLAMAFKVMDEAVEIFMNVLYQSFLIERFPFKNAARISRLALMQNRKRRARYMHMVDILDYIVPVVYCVVAAPSSPVSKSVDYFKPSKSAISYLERTLKSIGQVPPSERQVQDPSSSGDQDLLGRDTDILQLEILLSISKLILIHGQGGCGKSTLLRYSCRWWKASGWIQEFAYINLSDHDYGSAEELLGAIGEQLNMDEEHRSPDEIMDRFRRSRCLLVLDNLECISTPVLVDKTRADSDFIENVKGFIEQISRDSSMVILSSRQDTTPIADISKTQQCYCLGGLSTLASADLLKQIAFDGHRTGKKELMHRHNIDFLRRIVILLEGNPTAIKLIAPLLKKANSDAKALLNTLLYGTFDPDPTAHRQYRFVQTIYDLKYYYWFLYLPFSKYFQEGAYANWISDQFRKIVTGSQMDLKLQKYWPGISQNLIDAGVLQPAVIYREDAPTLPCYHVHPIFTLIMRGALRGENRKQAQYSYVRQFILWGRVDDSESLPEMRSAEWEDTIQHEDYVHNLKAVAVKWSIDDGDLDEEVERMGLSLFDVVTMYVTNSLYVNERQPQLFVPLYQQQLQRVEKRIALFRPKATATSSDLSTLLSLSWTLTRLEKDQSRAGGVVSSALAIVDKYKTASPNGAVLSPPQELSWFQLRHAEAKSKLTEDVYGAKKFLERNLADDPVTPTYEMAYNPIRRWQLQNLQLWVNCVADIGLIEGTIDKEQTIATARKFVADFEPGNMSAFVFDKLKEHSDVVHTLTLRELFSQAIDQEKDAVAKFGRLTNRILDESMPANFADLSQAMNLPPGVDIFSDLHGSYPSDSTEVDGIMEKVEFALRSLGGDPTAAALTLLPTLQREAQSSTTSTGWQNLAELHKMLFAAAVTENATPDYKKGLTHLNEWWKTTQGRGVPKKEICFTYLNYATCYNSLRQPVETARSVLRAVELIPLIQTTECLDEADAQGFYMFVYVRIADLDVLNSFLKKRYMFKAPEAFKGLNVDERVQLLKNVRIAKEMKRMKEEQDAEMEEMRILTERLKRFLGPVIE